MGQTISRARGALITRPMQRFNIDNRTDKLLNQEKPKPAPKYESDQQLLESIRRENPELLEATTKKDLDLLNKLEKIYVTSKDPLEFDPDINRKLPYNPNKPLPEKGIRSGPGGGFLEASMLQKRKRAGKLSIDDLQNVLARVSVPNAKAQACEQHKLSPEQYTRLVKHYRIFAKASIDKIVENDEEDDPYVKKDDWVSIDESEIAQNIPERKTISSPHTHKPLPPPSS